MEPKSRSAGRALLKGGVRCHAASTAITARNETALSEKTTPAPRAAVANAATARPPRAGPAARARLNPALFIAMASGNSGRGTNSGTIDCQAGLFKAEPILSRKVSASSVAGETIPASVRAARMATLASIHVCQKSSRRRRSKMSAAAAGGVAQGRAEAGWRRSASRR